MHITTHKKQSVELVYMIIYGGLLVGVARRKLPQLVKLAV
jgi:hypothetical protein